MTKGLQHLWQVVSTDRRAAAAALCLLLLVSYLPAMLSRDFIWDDLVMKDTPAVAAPDGLRTIWFSPDQIKAEGHYWPLVYTAFWLQHKLWGFTANAFHIVNVLLHLANSLLLWRILRRLEVTAAWLVAAVFAVHPVQVESVAWIIELKDVLSGLCYLLAVSAWIRFMDRPRPGPYLTALALYAAGMLAKSVVVTLPVALLILQWWKRGRVTATDLLRLTPFFAVGLAISVADLAFNRSQAVARFDYSFLERALIAARALWFSVGKRLWPVDLGGIYPQWEVRIADPLAWTGLAAALALVAALWLLRRRIGRGPLAGVLFFGITLSPTLGFVDYNFMLFAFVADRFQYLAGIGLLAVVIGAAARGLTAIREGRGLRNAALSGVLAAVLLGTLGTLTWRQASLYRDGITFFSYVIARNPEARYAHLNLGNALLRWNRLEESLEPYRVAMEQLPDDYKPHFGAGLALQSLGRLDEAAAAFSRSLELRSWHLRSLTGLTGVRLDQQQYEAALQVALRTIDLYPRNAEAWANRGIALHHLGRTDEALRSLDEALTLDPHQQRATDARAELVEESQRGR